MRKLSFISFMLFCIIANAQSQHYYYKGQKINLTVDRNYVNVIADKELLKSSAAHQLFQKFDVEQNDEQIQNGMVKLKFKSAPDIQEYSRVVKSLKQNENIKYVFPFFERGKAEPIGTSDVFYLKLKEIGDTVLLKKMSEQQNVQIIKQVPYMPLWYILSVQNSTFSSSVEASNHFYETGLFEDIDPAFMFHFKTNCVNDPLLSQLWGLKNNTYSEIDINACEAWTVTRGAGVNVAVIDEGIDPNHSDLSANFHPSSFDARSGTSPSVFIPGYAHGTHVAGTIAAVRNNNLQVVGVAPESKIMRISHNIAINHTLSAELASGISWAWQNGADVINNSWGDQGGEYYSFFHSAILENAITLAMTQGREGKGCVVVFASGNWGVIDYPASFHSDILCVGAIDLFGARSIFDAYRSSGYGAQLDVVAPGTAILSTTPNNSVGGMNGTSMAAPHVAGIAALILSVNPNLTQAQVRKAIESSCTKLSAYSFSNNSAHPNGTWNEQVGHGLVNASKAIFAALLEGVSISGPSALTPETPSGVYTISGVPQNATITWSVDPVVSADSSVINVPGTDTAITLSLTYPYECQAAWVDATISINSHQYTVRKRMSVGTPPDHRLVSSKYNNCYIGHGCHLLDQIMFNNEIITSHNNSYNISDWTVQWTTDAPLQLVPQPNSQSPSSSGVVLVDDPSIGLIVSWQPKFLNGDTIVHAYVRVGNHCGMGEPVTITYNRGKLCPSTDVGDPCNPSEEDNGLVVFSFSPNPVSDELSIDFEQLPETVQAETYWVKLLDNSGNVKHQKTFNHHHKNGKAKSVKFNMSNLSKGTYFLHVEGNGEIVKKQIVKK